MTKSPMNPACDMQLTQFAAPADMMTVAGGSCKSPYRCSKCNNRRQDRIADPEKKGAAYKAHGCERPDRTIDITSREWMDAEAKRISAIRGRVAEVRREEKNDGTFSDNIAVFTNRVASASGRVE